MLFGKSESIQDKNIEKTHFLLNFLSIKMFYVFFVVQTSVSHVNQNKKLKKAFL